MRAFWPVSRNGMSQFRRPLVIVIFEERFKARVNKLRSTVFCRCYTLWIENVDCIVSLRHCSNYERSEIRANVV